MSLQVHYDALLYVLFLPCTEFVPHNPWDPFYSLAVAPLRQVLGQIHACMPYCGAWFHSAGAGTGSGSGASAQGAPVHTYMSQQQQQQGLGGGGGAGAGGVLPVLPGCGVQLQQQQAHQRGGVVGGSGASGPVVGSHHGALHHQGSHVLAPPPASPMSPMHSYSQQAEPSASLLQWLFRSNAAGQHRTSDKDR